MMPSYDHAGVQLYVGDCRAVLAELPADSVQTAITSPPYWPMRAYAAGDGEIGQEPDMWDYLAQLRAVFGQVRRTLRLDGTLWIVIGDGYAGAGYSNHRGTGGRQREKGGKQKHTPVPAGLKRKDTLGIPWRLALSLQEDGWYLRADCIWEKPNGQPNKAGDRPWRTHEYVFLFSRSARYVYQPFFHDRSVIIEPITRTAGDHPATYPTELVKRLILQGSRRGDTVLDPFSGAGTTALVARALGRKAIGIELSPAYHAATIDRLSHPWIGD